MVLLYQNLKEEQSSLPEPERCQEEQGLNMVIGSESRDITEPLLQAARVESRWAGARSQGLKM